MTRGEKDLHSFQLYTRVYNCLSSDRKGERAIRPGVRCLFEIRAFVFTFIFTFSPSSATRQQQTKKRRPKEEKERERTR